MAARKNPKVDPIEALLAGHGGAVTSGAGRRHGRLNARTLARHDVIREKLAAPVKSGTHKAAAITPDDLTCGADAAPDEKTVRRLIKLVLSGQVESGTVGEKGYAPEIKAAAGWANAQIVKTASGAFVVKK